MYKKAQTIAKWGQFLNGLEMEIISLPVDNPLKVDKNENHKVSFSENVLMNLNIKLSKCQECCCLYANMQVFSEILSN